MNFAISFQMTTSLMSALLTGYQNRLSLLLPLSFQQLSMYWERLRLILKPLTMWPPWGCAWKQETAPRELESIGKFKTLPEESGALSVVTLGLDMRDGRSGEEAGLRIARLELPVSLWLVQKPAHRNARIALQSVVRPKTSALQRSNCSAHAGLFVTLTHDSGTTDRIFELGCESWEDYQTGFIAVILNTTKTGVNDAVYGFAMKHVMLAGKAAMPFNNELKAILKHTRA
ncbi:hypothetical protein BDR26DRAFT_957918 [Obelidium mucronatum]|nr:hypothetical protein BDR26DRAFT_957918 [Obelidium mucronatum]